MPNFLPVDVGLIIARFSLRSIIDIITIAFILYWVMILLKGTTAVTLLRGVAAVLVIGFVISSVFELTVLSWLLKNSLPALLVIIPVLFQPELRRVLEQVGRRFTVMNTPDTAVSHTIESVSDACATLSQRRHGALMVLEKETGLQDFVERGVTLDAEPSSGLLVGLFLPNSPLHDGAVIIRRGRVVAARCVLPLSDNTSGHLFGTRHRAAVGISERSDAVAVVVSEETGRISIATNGQLETDLDVSKLRGLLGTLYGSAPVNNTNGAVLSRS
ncbi:MAG: TIGR00159 family protein [Dehalococcoidia bacterium]|nr:TIGR00159 family protein [Dehalococcoidia bacterium]